MAISDAAGMHQKDLADEQTPLLANSTTESNADTEVATSPSSESSTVYGDDVVVDRPLPIAQIILLCYARTVEPLVFFAIFPFVNQMVQENGNLDEADVGFYSGLIESLFSITQMIVMMFWGRVADRIGRKPVLCGSLLGVAITAAMFGFARTVWQMLLFRCLAGMFAGSIVTIRTMISELSTRKTQSRAFSVFAFSNNLGMFFGPLIGGALADPARQYGGNFAKNAFFRNFPYALPTLATGTIALSAMVLCMLFVNETKPPQKSPASSASSTSSLDKPQVKSTWEIMRYPGVGTVLYLYGHSMMLAFAYTAVIPVFWFTSPRLGGFGFSPVYISLFMGLTGLAQAVWLLGVFPPFQRRVGTGGVLRICGTLYPLLYIPYPLLNMLLRSQSDAARIVFWVFTPPFLVLGVGVNMVVTAVQLALNDISPSHEVVGTINALALTLSSAMRAFSPWFFTSIFAIGVRSQILGGYLIWLVLIVAATIYGFAVRKLPARAAGNGYDSDSD